MGREKLQALLQSLLPDGGKAYFQPPSNVEMVYPCMVYKRDTGKTAFADNAPYRRLMRYMVTVIDRDPDSAIPDKVAELPTCVHVRSYVAENLNHDVFTLYF